MLEEPAAENLHGGIREGGDRLESWPTYTRTQLETADRSQGTPTIQGGLLYSEVEGTFGMWCTTLEDFGADGETRTPMGFPPPQDGVPVPPHPQFKNLTGDTREGRS
jgi:hypothetical protein